MLSIGEFSKICHVTTRTLRHYDDIDLIKPVKINGENNYRFYEVSQVRIMLLINRLKNYNFSFDEIKEILIRNDLEYTKNKIKEKREEIKEILNKYKNIEKSIKVDLLNLEKGYDIMSFIENIEVKIINAEDMNILSSRQIMKVDEYGKYIGKLFEIVAKNKLTVAGAPMSIYYDGEFNPEENDTEVALPVKESNEFTKVLKGGIYAMTVVKGPYSEKLPEGYGKMVEYIENSEYEIWGHPYEKYIKGPMDGEEIITEIYFPIKKK